MDKGFFQVSLQNELAGYVAIWLDMQPTPLKLLQLTHAVTTVSYLLLIYINACALHACMHVIFAVLQKYLTHKWNNITKRFQLTFQVFGAK